MSKQHLSRNGRVTLEMLVRPYIWNVKEDENILVMCPSSFSYLSPGFSGIGPEGRELGYWMANPDPDSPEDFLYLGKDWNEEVAPKLIESGLAKYASKQEASQVRLDSSWPKRHPKGSSRNSQKKAKRKAAKASRRQNRKK